MPRPKTLSDEDVLESRLQAHPRARARGADLRSSLPQACGLSPATLVQRFRSKAGLKQSTLLHAWDRLDEKTAGSRPRSPKTARRRDRRSWSALSGDYGGIEAYAEGLLVLREDLRDPVLRARGAAWKAALSAALDECFAKRPARRPASAC